MNLIEKSRNDLKHLALAVAMGIGLGAGSVHAATTSQTYNLGTSPEGTTIEGAGAGTLFVWIAKGSLPPGSILRSVTATAVKIEANPSGSWASDLGVFIDPTPETPGGPGGLLRIADDSDFGGAIEGMNWNGDGQGDGPMTQTLTAGVQFSDTIDLSTAAVMIGSAWGTAKWSGTITVEYDLFEPARIMSFGPGGVIDQNLKTIAWTVPNGTDLGTLTPAITVSSGDCVPASGASPVLDGSNQATYTVTDGATVNVYTLTVTVAPPETALIWNTGSGAWDFATPNWKGQTSGSSMPFFNTANVILDDTVAGGTITIAAGMLPTSTTVSNRNYVFTGAPIGSGSLTKSGSGTLSLEATPANFSSIAVNGGTLYLHAADHFLGSGAPFNMGTGTVTVESGASIEGERAYMAGSLIMNGGTWWENNGFSGSWNGPVNLAADSFFGHSGWCMSQRINGVVSGPGGLTWLGGDYGAMLTLNGASTYTGKTIVIKNMLRAGAAGEPAGLSNEGVAGALGAPTGANAVIDLFNGAGLYVGDSNPRVNQSTDRTINLAGNGVGTVSIKVNDNDTSFTFGAVTATGTGAKTLALFTGAGGNGDREALTINGVISDVADASPLGLQVTFNCQTGSYSYVNLPATNTFTGPITLAKGDTLTRGYLTIGGVRAPGSGANTVGTGTLGGGNFPGAITVGASTVLEYDSTATQTLSGAISGAGDLQVTGSGTLTLAGTNTYSGNTTVNSGCSLVLDAAGTMTFAVAVGSNNKLTGAGSATLDGTFAIDTSGLSPAIADGSWTLVDVTSPTYGGTFSVAGFTNSGGVWSKVAGPSTWTFNQASGVLSLTSAGAFTSFAGPPLSSAIIDNSAFTIQLKVPNGTDLATLAPTFTVSSGTCNQTSGAVPSPTFAAANPVTYTITDGAIVNHYAVTVTVLPAGPGNVVSGLVLWLDASVSDTMTLSGTTVDEWRDLLGNGAKATRRGGAPTLVASGIGGVPTVHFDSSSWMNDGVNHSAPVTIFYVSRETGGNNNRVLGASSNNWLMGYHGGQRSRFYFEGWVNEAGLSPDTNPHMYAATIGGSGVNSTVYAEGVQIASNQNGVTGPNNLQLNGYQSANELSDCDISEVVVYNRILSVEELNAVGAYFASKYGLTIAVIPTPGPILVGTTTMPLTFDAVPDLTQWSCYSIAGGGGTATDLTTLDAQVNTVAASSFGALPTVTADPTGGEAVAGAWNSTALRLTSRATGNTAGAMMASLKNTTGAAISSLDISFTLSGGGTDPELPGYALYYSLTGEAGSWQPIGLFSTLGAVTASNIALTSPWANGAMLYVLWVDDNANGVGDYWYGIDDVSFSKTAAGGGYAAWAATYAGGQAANLDYNNDGVANGIAYFMGMNGLATNPGVVDGKVTWPHVNAVTSFGVEVSDNLADWSPATTGVDTSDPTKVVFTLPTGAAKKFCRLMVVP